MRMSALSYVSHHIPCCPGGSDGGSRDRFLEVGEGYLECRAINNKTEFTATEEMVRAPLHRGSNIEKVARNTCAN